MRQSKEYVRTVQYHTKKNGNCCEEATKREEHKNKHVRYKQYTVLRTDVRLSFSHT